MIKFSIYTLPLLVLALLLPVQSATAASVVRVGDEISVAEDQLIEGDFYSTASIVNISGEIRDDALLGGGAVTVNGSVGADALIVGGSVDVHGAVGDDLRIIGGDVIVAEPVAGDLTVVGGTIKILSTASVGGDILLLGGEAEVSAPVEGDIIGNIGTLRLDSAVNGDVNVTVDEVTLGDRARVAGTVTYVSQRNITRAQDAQVEGDIVRNDPVFEPAGFSAQNILIPFLVLLFSVAVWYLLARRMLTRVVNRTLLPGIRPFIIGSLVFLLAPFAVSILMVSMLGLFAGITLLLSYLLFLVLAIVALPAVLGQLVLSVVNKEPKSLSLLTLVIGSVIVVACMFIPVVGPLALFGFVVLVFGGMIDLLLRSNR